MASPFRGSSQSSLSAGHGAEPSRFQHSGVKLHQGISPFPAAFPPSSQTGERTASLSVCWGASEAELSRKEDFPLSLGKDGCGGNPSPLPTDVRMGEQTPSWRMELFLKLHRPLSTSQGALSMWRDQKSPELSSTPNGTVPFRPCRRVWFGFFFFTQKALSFTQKETFQK